MEVLLLVSDRGHSAIGEVEEQGAETGEPSVEVFYQSIYIPPCVQIHPNHLEKQHI